MQQQLDHVDEDKARDLIRDAIESLSEAFALYDEDNRLVLYNRRFTDMCGTVSSLLEPGLSWEILLREFTRRGIHLHAAGRQEAWVSSHFFDRLDYVQDLEMEHPDGSSFMVSLHPTKMRGFAVTGTDNTLKKQAEAVERDSELLVRTVLESSPANVVMARMGDGSIVYRSEAAKTLFGDTESARDFYLSPEDRADYIISMLPDGAVDDYRVVMINAKGKPFPASVSGRIAEFKGEDVVVSTTVDLTVQVEATALIRQVLEACPVPVQMTEAETGRLLFASPETTALFGSVENAGSYYVDPDARLRYISELRSRGWVKNYKIELKNAAGQNFWGSVSARLIDFQGQPVVVSNTTDLTDDLAIQEQLEKQRERLFQNEKMSALGELLAGVAHELNNPLTVVVGHSMMLLEDVEDPDTHKRVEKISKAAERCAKIVKTFLAMARQQPGKMEVTDINSVIKTAVDVAGYGHAADGMDISCRLDESVPSIIADGDQITQVIINLVINSEQAMSKSGIGNRIEVSTRSNQAANTVEIRIKDNGPGVPDAIRGRIFEPFFTTKDVGDGTGIGLAFCHRIILSHGGHIWLDHNYRNGSRFCIRLPITSRTHPAADEESAQQSERNLQILVLDDEADVAELISIILQKEGFRVDIANRGEDALEMLRNGTYDIVLSDLNMPGMDGRAVFETIRKDFPHMLDRIGFITGDTMGAASQSLLEESGRPHLEKPVSPADLRQLIGRLLGENGGEQ